MRRQIGSWIGLAVSHGCYDLFIDHLPSREALFSHAVTSPYMLELICPLIPQRSLVPLPP
jgi:hypothetical protein